MHTFLADKHQDLKCRQRGFCRSHAVELVFLGTTLTKDCSDSDRCCNTLDPPMGDSVTFSTKGFQHPKWHYKVSPKYIGHRLSSSHSHFSHSLCSVSWVNLPTSLSESASGLRVGIREPGRRWYSTNRHCKAEPFLTQPLTCWVGQL